MDLDGPEHSSRSDMEFSHLQTESSVLKSNLRQTEGQFSKKENSRSAVFKDASKHNFTTVESHNDKWTDRFCVL